MIFKKLPILFLLVFSISACADKKDEEKGASSLASFSWEIVDSLDFAYLGDAYLGAVNEKANRAVYYNYAESNILFSDLEGNLISKMKKNGDTPDSYGFILELPGFYNQESIAILALPGVFLYDLSGNLIKKFEHPEGVGIAAFMSKVGKTIKQTNFNGRDYILSKSYRSHESYPGEKKFYEDFHALELIDVESEVSKEIVPFPKNSKFLDGMGYFPSDYEPAYAAEEDKLFVALGGEPILYVYNLNESEAELDTLINLEIPEFQEIEGKDLALFEEGTLSVTSSTPSIRDIHIVKDKIVVSFYCGMDPKKLEDIDAMYQSGQEDEADLLYDKLEKKVKNGVLIFNKNNLQFLGRIDMNEKLPSASFASDGEFLWMQKPASEEIEEDFIRIYKVRIAEK